MQPQELDHGQRQHTKHQLGHDLLRSSHPDLAAQEFIIQPAESPFLHRSGFVSILLGGIPFRLEFHARRQLRFWFRPRMEVDDRLVVPLLTCRPNRLGVVSGIHQIVEIGDATGSHMRQRNRHL